MLTCSFLETPRGVAKGVEVIPLEFFWSTICFFFFLCTVNHITNGVSLVLERVCVQEWGCVPCATHRGLGGEPERWHWNKAVFEISCSFFHLCH